MRSALLVLVLGLIATPAAAQGETVVTPTWVHSDPPLVQDQVCTQTVPCTPVPPCPAHPTLTPPAGCPATIRLERRSAPLFWLGAGLVGGGATLVVGAFTWARTSEITAGPTAPCGTDPYTTRYPIAPCTVSGPLLAAGLSMIGSGTVLMIYGGERVAVGTDGRQVTVRVRF